ncbi:universal stress protein [Mycobacterium bourgelatii]|uniref:Universal stress protein n=1 Tax=Mycobacterium bourgelatii TaxID=1273442 RepID=A0A7I9YKV3_MYCBU|nr:universal stress protein [Mycobacterium bourgelatii]MCV6974724.1 universal stress protein [Mycobacterium bourgelatii]GFG89192.1 universal stress protein [Mycobacterium bourgelatii]
MWQPPRGSILVGIDGSAAALAAVRWAARDAALRKLPLALVHVVDASLPEWFEVSALAGFRQRQEQRAREFLESAIEAAEESFGECDPVPIDSNVFHSASVSALVGLSAEVAMVVVGRRGHGASVYNVPGRVSSALVYHAHCPVAVIHESEGAIRNFEHAPVLVGIDGSPASEAATGIAFEEASRRGVGLTALHVWVDPYVSGSKTKYQDAKWDARLAEEEETLAERLAGWHDRYPDVAVHRRVEIGDPAHWLIEASELTQLIVVGSHGCSPLRGTLLGSVGAAVVNRAKVPVIVARWS